MPTYKASLTTIASLTISAVLVFVMQLLPFSFRRLLIDSAVLTGPELGALEITIGFANSLIVTAICLAILKRPVIQIVVAALLSQIAWIEWSYSFRQGGNTLVEALLRYSEHVGVIVGAITAAFLFVRVFSRAKPAS